MSERIADTVRMAELDVPVLVQATPDSTAKMTIAFRRDSFCGKMSACNNLKQYGIPYSLTTLHTVSPNSEEFQSDLPGSPQSAAVQTDAESARRRYWGSTSRVQHSALQRKDSRIAGYLGRDSRSLGNSGPYRPAERYRRATLKQNWQKFSNMSPLATFPKSALIKMAKLGS